MTSRFAKACLGALCVVVAGFASACQTPPRVGLTPLSEPSQLQPAPPRVNSAVVSNRERRIAFVDRGVPQQPSAAPPLPPGRATERGDVTLNFADTDIREIARVILGTTLKLDYTIDPRVHGAGTIDTGTPLPRSALLPTLETLLNQNGATLIRKDGLYQVVPIAAATATNTVAGINGAGTGSQLIRLHFAAAGDLAKVIQPYIGEGSKITADPAHNALIISGDATARQALIGLIRAFDVDALAGQSFALFPVEAGAAESSASAVEKALRAENGAPNSGLVKVVPLPRVNAVLVASSQSRYIDAARRFFRLAGRVEDVTARSWHVYYVQNGQSADLANLLQRAFTPGHVTAPAAPGRTAPGLERVAMGAQGFQAGAFGTASRSGGPSALSTAQQTTGALGAAPAAAAARAPATSQAPATEPLSETTAGETENRIRIISNPSNNALLIYATPREYSVIDGMLRKIDIVPLQVLIDATIAEVTLNNALQYGTQFFFKLDHVSETLGAIPAFPPAPLPPTGLVGFAVSKAPHFILQALADVTKVKVLSAPQVLVMDNEPARLQVGQQVPVLTGTATSTLTTGAPIVNSIDYHSTGVIMEVTPRINSGGLVTLDIAQEVSDVAPPAANTAEGSPTFDDRILRTRVAVQDGQTVALAGLIRDTTTEGNNGIPFLKDIPILSTLLSSQSDTRARTELLVLITPHVVNDQRDALALTEDLRNQMINAALVRPELQHRAIPGLANPNGL
jgi:general secretion pathway protein D